MSKITCPKCGKGDLFLEEKMFAYKSNSLELINGKIVMGDNDLGIEYSDTHSVQFACNECYAYFEINEIVDKMGCDFE